MATNVPYVDCYIRGELPGRCEGQHVGAGLEPLRLESQEARQARMAEDHQLAQVLQDIEATERGDWVEEPCRCRLRIEIDEIDRYI